MTTAMIVVAFAAGGVLLIAVASRLLPRILPPDIPALRAVEPSDVRPQDMPAPRAVEGREGRPKGVQRGVTGTIGALLAVLALLAFLSAFVAAESGSGKSFDDPAAGDLFAASVILVLIGISLMIVAAAFILARFLPSRVLRRVAIGLCASLLASPLVWVVGGVSSVGTPFVGWVVAIVAFCAAYRLAR